MTRATRGALSTLPKGSKAPERVGGFRAFLGPGRPCR